MFPAPIGSHQATSGHIGRPHGTFWWGSIVTGTRGNNFVHEPVFTGTLDMEILPAMEVHSFASAGVSVALQYPETVVSLTVHVRTWPQFISLGSLGPGASLSLASAL